MFVRSRSIVRDYNISLFIRGQVHPMKTPGLIGDPSMQCRRTDFRPPTSSLHRPSPCGGYLFKVALSPALLNTHTHPGEFTVEGDPVSSFRVSSESSRIPDLPVSPGWTVDNFLFSMVPTDRGGPQGQHLSDPWVSGHVVFVCVKDRSENFHFRNIRRTQDHTCGGRTDTVNRLNESFKRKTNCKKRCFKRLISHL